MRLLVKKLSGSSPEVMISAWARLPSAKSVLAMAVRRIENHGEDDEEEDTEEACKGWVE